jgi:hypothetical protein
MGEEVGGSVKPGSGKSSVVIVVSGKPSSKCIEFLRVLLKKWAKRCGLRIASVKVQKKKSKKKK